MHIFGGLQCSADFCQCEQCLNSIIYLEDIVLVITWIF